MSVSNPFGADITDGAAEVHPSDDKPLPDYTKLPFKKLQAAVRSKRRPFERLALLNAIEIRLHRPSRPPKEALNAAIWAVPSEQPWLKSAAEKLRRGLKVALKV